MSKKKKIIIGAGSAVAVILLVIGIVFAVKKTTGKEVPVVPVSDMSWGYWGMLVSAFLAGSFFPFSSEVVMSGLQAAGLEPIQLVLYGSIGNVLGSMFNYGVGRMGKLEWIEKYLHVKKESLDKAQHFMADRGAWMGFFAFLPLFLSLLFLLGILTKHDVRWVKKLIQGK